ncbi:MAG: hypothetical protein JWO38_6573 [Gemmataceae bacterium]|nr:hypothetical protein [Gemmataceae bacterium]
MDTTEFVSAQDVLVLIDTPTALTYPQSRDVEVETAGVRGSGPTPADAAADWGRKFAAMVTLPRDMAEEEDDEDDTDVDRGGPSLPTGGEETSIETG